MKCSLSVSGDSIIVVTLLSPIAVTVLIVNNQTVKQQSVTGDRYIIKIRFFVKFGGTSSIVNK